MVPLLSLLNIIYSFLSRAFHVCTFDLRKPVFSLLVNYPPLSWLMSLFFLDLWYLCFPWRHLLFFLWHTSCIGFELSHSSSSPPASFWSGGVSGSLNSWTAYCWNCEGEHISFHASHGVAGYFLSDESCRPWWALNSACLCLRCL